MAVYNRYIRMTEATQAETPINDGMNAIERVVKRFVDVAAAAIGLILLSPLFLYIVLKIKSEHDGTVIFRQERIGYKGRPFEILKFRTLAKDSEEDGIPKSITENSDKITEVGQFLRSHHLDELPQLINIIRGDMSLVGPRPERKYFIDKIMEHDKRYEQLYQIRPGATSMATIYNGYTDTMDKMLTRLHMDLDYLEHRSLWLDLKILFLTATRFISGKVF